jgi:hypothetical protein
MQDKLINILAMNEIEIDVRNTQRGNILQNKTTVIIDYLITF